MKRWLLLILVNIAFTATFCWVNCYNNTLKKQVKNFSQKQDYVKKLLEENAKLKYPWHKKDLDMKDFLTNTLGVNVLKSEISSQSVKKLHRPNVSYSEGYIMGYLWYDECCRTLEMLVEQDLPLWINSLSIDRDIYENYNLQFSMTYVVGRLETP